MSSLECFDDLVTLCLVSFLDNRSAGRLGCASRLLNDRLETYWFWSAQKLGRQLDKGLDSDDDASDDDASDDDASDDDASDDSDSLDIEAVPETASGVNWKKTLAFYHRHYRLSPNSYREPLTEYIQTLAGRRAETHVQCSGSTDMKPDLYVPAAAMHLSVPLDPNKLRALIDGQYCEQAPIGKGTDTLVDLDTRKGWRLMLGKDVLIGNADWNSSLTRAGFNVDSILHDVQEKLMPHTFGKGDVWAQPYCMLIYEEGDFFKPHRDTLRGPNHFGSLIISLPVQGGSKGGEFVLTHNSASSETHRTLASHSPPRETDNCKYYAFYTDVFHQVHPVTAGYRVALNYHLWAVPSGQGFGAPIPRPITTTADEASSTLLLMTLFNHGLKRHFKYRDGEARYVLALDHKYGFRTLNYFNLRGRDRIHYDVLTDVTDDDVEVNLDILSVERFDKPQDPSKYKDLTLVYVDEDKKDTGRASSATIWLNQERFLAMEHEFESYEYYTGNEGYTSDYMYRHACVIFEPEGFELEYDY